MILSFVIFIGFVVAMLIFMNPAREQKINYASVDIVENKIMENMSFAYSYFGLILNNAVSGCFVVDNPGQSGNIIARDMNGAVKTANNDFPARKIYITSSSGERFYRLYFSNKFNNYSIANTGSCTVLTSANYTFGPLYTDKAILLDNVQPLYDAYMSDYSGLKASLGANEDFEFSIYDLNRTQTFFDTSSKHKIKTTLVLSRDLPIRVVDKNANMTDIILNIKVW